MSTHRPAPFLRPRAYRAFRRGGNGPRVQVSSDSPNTERNRSVPDNLNDHTLTPCDLNHKSRKRPQSDDIRARGKRRRTGSPGVEQVWRARTRFGPAPLLPGLQIGHDQEVSPTGGTGTVHVDVAPPVAHLGPLPTDRLRYWRGIEPLPVDVEQHGAGDESFLPVQIVVAQRGKDALARPEPAARFRLHLDLARRDPAHQAELLDADGAGKDN